MGNLFEDLKSKVNNLIVKKRKELKSILEQKASKLVDEVTVEKLIHGMRSVKAVLCDTSEVPPEKGVVIRGIPIYELKDRYVEDLFYFLLTGELPDEETSKLFRRFIVSKAYVGSEIIDAINMMPTLTPMAMLSVGVLMLQKTSSFFSNYHKIKKDEYWIYTLEDALNIVAKTAYIAGCVYQKLYRNKITKTDFSSEDIGGMLSELLIDNYSKEFKDLIRLFLTLHIDHEGGNASAFTGLVVNSTLSDLYYSFSASLNALAGPLHGLANQESIKWILSMIEELGDSPSIEEIEKYAWKTLNSGKVIPGYGHAVLRVTDPRFLAFYEFAEKNCKDSKIFNIVKKIYEVVPEVLKKTGKVKDPWPNVDAISGALLYYYGVKEFEFYTCLFGVSRAFGVSAQAVINRGLMLPILRPKSVTIDYLKEI
ncbi:MAG: citrate (Si)-synthase [bacterium]|nr:citrate (Si)-synthase [bacterium]